MSDLSAEAVLLRRKLLAERGYRPVPVDGDGNPLGAAWRAEALQDPPRATVTPVDPNAPYTGLLLGAEGDVEALIAVDLVDGDAVTAAVIAALDKRIGRTPCRLRIGDPGSESDTGFMLLYRSRGSTAWGRDDGIRSSGVLFDRGEKDARWPDRRPEDVAFADLPLLDNEAWQAIAAGVGAALGGKDLFDELDIEDVPAADEPPKERGFGPRLVHRGPPPEEPPPSDEPPDGPLPPRPTITVKSGKRHIAADKGLRALYGANVPFYNRAGQLVRVEPSPARDAAGNLLSIPAIRAVPLTALGRALGQVAIWQRLNRKGEPYQVDPPNPVVEMIAGMADRWKFPPIAGLVRTPTLRSDLSLLDRPGYDPATGLYAVFGELNVPRIAARPSRQEAEAALKLLLGALDGFPFVSDRDRAAAVAGLLTAMFRPAFDAAPMFVISSPLPGTGKSYLADCIAAVATGDRAAVIAVAPREEETEKRLIGAALLGNPIIVLDNVRRLLEGDFLCQVTERPLLQLRPLGTSDVRQIRNVFTTFATGNNVVTAADMTRRSLGVAMDANCERPELREFDGDPRQEILKHRGSYIAACLRIVRYYIGAGRPNLRPRLASYELWSDLVRSPLAHLGLPDPVETQRALAADDPVVQHRRAIFAAWDEAVARQLVPLHERGLRVRELVELANADGNSDLLEALRDVAEGQHGNAGRLDHGRLGRWLWWAEDTIAGDRKLVCDRSDPSRPRWRLDPVIPAIEVTGPDLG
jgi:putative DNA primase/helicase